MLVVNNNIIYGNWECLPKQKLINDTVFYATFNNISAILWMSDLLVEETGVPGENHRPVASH
jgi:hypothetical protein